MSATFPNISDIAQWLNAELYVSDFRPVEVKEYLKFGQEIYASDGITLLKKLPFP